MSGLITYSAVEWPEAYQGGMADAEQWSVFPDTIVAVPPAIYVVGRWCTRDVTIVDDECPDWR